jgi:aspartyl-tRNA(Asn)/glutamyl-tRNA(Gln) amidotransferase subunit C
MQLNKDEIQHIANLARLDLSNEELEVYGGQLAEVLNYIEQLKEVDTAGVEPMAHATGVENVLREDEKEEWDEREREEALRQAPELEEREVKVRRVLE